MMTWNKLRFGNKTHVMGIINVTPDSFSGDGLIADPFSYVNYALVKARMFAQQGADIIDVGGESTRPGAAHVPVEEEIRRVIPVIAAIKQNINIPVSVDTTKADVAEEALKLGADMINDVSGLMMHPRMIEIARKYKCHMVITNSYQHPSIEQRELGGRYLTSRSDNVVDEVMHDLEKLAVYSISHGLLPEQIILDPGIGYGKNLAQNLALLKNIDRLKSLGYPVLVGVSRKSFIGHITGASVHDRLGGGIAANVIAAFKGADVVRVHDVAESVQALAVARAIMEAD